jgi:DNA topoisomerase-1
MVAVLDLTLIRIGNEEYVRENGSYGLATLRTRHVKIEAGRVILRFRAKAGLRREVIIEDKRLVRLLKQLKKVRGTHVFQYVGEGGEIHRADAIAVNDYLRERSGHHFTAKDFRTWKASAIATSLLYDQRSLEKPAARKRVAKSAIAAVADALGNTATISRKYYIHPGLMDAYLDGQFPEIFQRFRTSRKKSFAPSEQLFARFLRHSWHSGC